MDRIKVTRAALSAAVTDYETSEPGLFGTVWTVIEETGAGESVAELLATYIVTEHQEEVFAWLDAQACR